MGMIRGTGFGVGLTLALVPALVGGTALPAALDAQVVVGGRECRCVDSDGNAIENCTCFRAGDGGLESFTLSGLGLDRRAQIGVYIDMTQDDAAVGGVLVTDVTDGSPAEAAGLMAGDVVVSVDGRSVFDALDADAEEDLDDERSLATQRFAKIVGDLDPDEEVEIVVRRDGTQRLLRVTPEAARNVFRYLGPDGEMEFDFRGRFDFDEAEMRGLRESLEEAGEQLRGYNFRFEGDREVLEERIREQALRAEEQARRMQQLAERQGAQWENLQEQLEEAGVRRDGVLFRRASMDPCVQLRTRGGDDARVMVFGTVGCVDGIRVTDMNEGLATYFGTDEGALVTEVAESSSLGLVAGDVILSIGDREVTESADVHRILASYDADETVTLRVRRENREIQVSGTRRAN